MAENNYMSIGDLAKRSGLSVFRLRAWESRYGYPAPQKLQSGHRRFLQGDLQKLLIVQQLLENGFKISKIIDKSKEELIDLLPRESTTLQTLSLPLKSKESADPHKLLPTIKQALQHINAFDESALHDIFAEVWGNSTPLDFCENFVTPFTFQLGDQWENGFLDIAMEHFASKCLENFIDTKWREANRLLNGKPLLLGMLPNDFHSFGLQMCALLAVYENIKIVYLGERTPIEAIETATRDLDTLGVVLSISKTMTDKVTMDYLKQLRKEIPKEISIVIGGGGAYKIKGIDEITQFREYISWVQKRK